MNILTRVQVRTLRKVLNLIPDWLLILARVLIRNLKLVEAWLRTLVPLVRILAPVYLWILIRSLAPVCLWILVRILNPVWLCLLVQGLILVLKIIDIYWMRWFLIIFIIFFQTDFRSVIFFQNDFRSKDSFIGSSSISRELLILSCWYNQSTICTKVYLSNITIMFS